MEQKIYFVFRHTFVLRKYMKVQVQVKLPGAISEGLVALLILNLGTGWGVSRQPHASTALITIRFEQ